MTPAYNTLVIGSPGAGKSVGAAADAVTFPGAIYIADPHKDSLAYLVIQHIRGYVLYDRLSDLKRPLRSNFLKPFTGSDPDEVLAKNHRAAMLFTEILMRRRTSDIATMPLLEEWLSALLMLFLFQRTRLSLRILPFGFVPNTKEFETLVEGCTLPEIRAKFRSLAKLNPRALRAEVGSATRLINAVFRSPHFLARCDGEFDIDAFVKAKGKLIVEKGDEVDDDATTTILSARTLAFIDYAKARSGAIPSIRIYLDEGTNAKTAGKIEEKAAGETRKNGLTWYVMCQWPNFPGGTDGYFQNFQRKEIYRTSDRDLARKMANIIASEHPSYETTRASQVDAITSEIMTLSTGWRFITGPGGSRSPQYVQPLKHLWPDWPGLREAKLQEKLACIYSRTEYQKPEEPTSVSSSQSETPRPAKSPEDSSPANRWRRRESGPADSLPKNESGDESDSKG